MVPFIAACLALLSANGVPVAASAPPAHATTLAKAAPQESTRPYPLARVEFTGLRLVPRARALAIAGLRTNTTVTARDVEAATARLADSGLFASASHRYRMEGYSLVVIFVLEEAAWDTPVVFDNFVGYRDEELTAALAARFPVFKGNAPDQPAVLNRIAATLKGVVGSRHPSANVSYVTAGASSRLPRHYRFRMELPGRTFPICCVAIAGLSGDGQIAAADKARSLVGTDYSRDFVGEFAERTVRPVAQRGGHYLARIVSSTLNASQDEACPGGADVTITIETGRSYTWGTVGWAGASAARPEDLSAVQRMRPGEPAEAERLQQTIDAAVRWYHDRGYMTVQVSPVTAVYEDRASVDCDMSVDEGARFRFGRLELSGLDAEALARIRDRWSLAAGEFYDGEYTRRFVAQVRDAEASALAGRTSITIRERPDATAVRVDVTLEFAKSGS